MRIIDTIACLPNYGKAKKALILIARAGSTIRYDQLPGINVKFRESTMLYQAGYLTVVDQYPVPGGSDPVYSLSYPKYLMLQPALG